MIEGIILTLLDPWKFRWHALPKRRTTMRAFKTKTNSVALSPRTNYTDWATDTCRWKLVPTFADRGVSRGQRGGSPTVVNLSFLDRCAHLRCKITRGESVSRQNDVEVTCRTNTETLSILTPQWLGKRGSIWHESRWYDNALRRWRIHLKQWSHDD
jgi:hypothetical protein